MKDYRETLSLSVFCYPFYITLIIALLAAAIYGAIYGAMIGFPGSTTDSSDGFPNTTTDGSVGFPDIITDSSVGFADASTDSLDGLQDITTDGSVGIPDSTSDTSVHNYTGKTNWEIKQHLQWKVMGPFKYLSSFTNLLVQQEIMRNMFGYFSSIVGIQFSYDTLLSLAFCDGKHCSFVFHDRRKWCHVCCQCQYLLHSLSSCNCTCY